MSSQTPPGKTKFVQTAADLSCKVAKPKPDIPNKITKKKKKKEDELGRKDTVDFGFFKAPVL